mgnify:CR=1 FL=1
MNYRRELENTVQKMLKMRAADTIELRKLPKGDITIYHSGSKLRFTHERYDHGVRLRKGITRNSILVAKLLRKRYVRAEAAVLDRTAGRGQRGSQERQTIQHHLLVHHGDSICHWLHHGNNHDYG